ncbi:hypothetical protein [Alteribacillus iranensis]|uniref:Nitrate reductase alpha subunit n=1 Tax=Alteribacillus iranensis TaxID=930128 RepID=A0A1I2E778_9BACI|nr:nitrate reductase alpha subunit [Alteribacillus iranensis]
MSKMDNKFFMRLKHLKRGERINDSWTEESPWKREWEDLYRRRWQFDKVVHSELYWVLQLENLCERRHYHDRNTTNGLSTTGSVFSEYEPRGCPRGLVFPGTYSPIRVKHPYIRSDLDELWKSELDEGKDPVSAWENIVTDPDKREQYVKANVGKAHSSPWHRDRL